MYTNTGTGTMNILKTISLQIWVSGNICLAPFQFQHTRLARKVVTVSRHKYKWRCWIFWRIIITLFAVCMTVRVIHTLVAGKSQVNVAYSLLLMMWTTFSLGTHWSQTNIASKTEEIPLLVNSVILFQKKNGIGILIKILSNCKFTKVESMPKLIYFFGTSRER